MKRNFRFGTVTAESYLGPAPDTTNLPTKQVREEKAMFAATAFAVQADVEHQSFSDLNITLEIAARALRGICWRRGWESNPRIKVLQTSPLPLGYRASVIQYIETVLHFQPGRWRA
jgi:hypothetical protein